MQVNLGKTIRVKGELTGSEDLTIDGQVEGKVFLADHLLTVGENGNLKADVQAKGVIVSGKLIGNITATDRVEVTASGSLHGDVRAPRVVLADGARFKGSIDMEPAAASRAAATAASTGAKAHAATATATAAGGPGRAGTTPPARASS